MQKILLSISSILRALPSFRGKYRLGLLLERLLLRKNRWNIKKVKIRLKNGTFMQIDPRSKMHKAVLYCGQYDKEYINFFSGFIQPGWVFLDVGASIGYWTLPLLKKISSIKSGQVISFEPLPKNIETLVENVSINNLSQNFKLYPFALGDYDGSIIIHATEEGDSGNAYVSKDRIVEISQNYEMAIPIKKLDSIIEEFSRCDFIKMDIEGFEIFVINGGLKFIEKFTPFIFGEFNSYFLEKSGFTIIDINNVLVPLGYSPFKIINGILTRIKIENGLEDVFYVHYSKLLIIEGIAPSKKLEFV